LAIHLGFTPEGDVAVFSVVGVVGALEGAIAAARAEE